ncbi:nucleoside 2-deoxyribosyltransferase domain-containing protein [Streptomyces sp. MNU76]|uniref:nucleoside 2-deoxyribosyltransferase domain-containing protein n=1 Tax=Streptomyces sp. MNU76 TaxID=2560026 RepID=UPI001E5F205C|nr:nucleoside 2-deoxyribosyltransferase domain-containing protein [Streptomyces sp. MNU76]MCC9711755.1 nucleoside 2-deoxyribosyltransferase domain-containing protein [Streptomyces sp. MNU76]
MDAIGSPAVVLNPRRDDFPACHVEAAREQTAWEYEHLRIADVILFWFCAEAVQPIALYELEAQAARGTRLAVGRDRSRDSVGLCPEHEVELHVGELREVMLCGR